MFSRNRKRCFSVIAAMLLMRGGETGPTPHNARNRKGGARRIARMSAAMEAAMTRRLDAFATPVVYLIAGAGNTVPPRDPGAPIKRI